MKIACCLMLFLLAPVAQAQQTAPDVLVRNITQEVLDAIKQDKDIQSGNMQKITALVETKIVPNFDFARMARIAMARNWRNASPEQQQKLVGEFRTLLVRTYSGALATFRDQVVDVKPLRAKPEDTDVTVRSEVKRPGAQASAIDYDMTKNPDGWKVYDVKVDGVSLVTTYRDSFAAEVRDHGIDGLIQLLVAKNRAGAAGKS